MDCRLIFIKFGVFFAKINGLKRGLRVGSYKSEDFLQNIRD
jgi:hypothetical protein